MEEELSEKSLDWKLKRIISEFDEISTAKVILDEEDNIVEIEIHLKTPSVDREFLTSRIQYLIEKKTGKKINSEKFHVLYDQKPSSPPETQVPERPILLSNITTSMDRNSFGITIKLKIKGKETSGHASGMLPVNNQARLSAEATLKAVTNFFQNGTTLSVAGVRTENLVDENIVLVLVNILDNGTVRKTLVGASIMKIDPSQTAAYATLDALNRYFPQLQVVERR